MKKLLTLAGVALAISALGAGSALAGAPAPTDPNPAGRALVCHVTGSATNPIVEIYVPAVSKAPRQDPCEDQGGGDL